jgi:hypothetical protein
VCLDAILDDFEEERLIFWLIIEGKRVDKNALPYIHSEILLKIKKRRNKKMV